MLIGIGYILVVCVLYIHLGMGDTLGRIFHSEAYVFKCVKCITWQSVLAYTICLSDLNVLACLAISFASAYVALWLELALSKLASLYEKWSEENVVAGEPERQAAYSTKQRD